PSHVLHLFFYGHRAPLALPSFPTRRSSDLSRPPTSTLSPRTCSTGPGWQRRCCWTTRFYDGPDERGDRHSCPPGMDCAGGHGARSEERRVGKGWWCGLAEL